MTKVVAGPPAGFLVLCLSLAFAVPAAGGQVSRHRPILNACAGNPGPGYWSTRLAAQAPRMRSRGASALGKMRAKKMVPALIRALDDGDPRVRGSVVEALERIDPDAKAAIPALRRTPSDDDLEIRAMAQRTLERIGAQ